MRAVALVARHPVVTVPIEAAILDVREIVESSVVMAILVVEAARVGRYSGLKWPRCHLPVIAVSYPASLSRWGSVRSTSSGRPYRTPGADDANLEPVPHRVAHRHQRRPGRAANRLNIELLEPGPRHWRACPGWES